MNGSRSHGGTLSPEALARYEHDGFFFPLDVLDPEEVAAMRIQLEDFEERYESHPAVGHGAFRTSCHLFLPFLDGLIRHPAILGSVASILGEDLLVWGTSFFTKEPRSADYVAWHQDLHYWGLDARDEVTVWVALLMLVQGQNEVDRTVDGIVLSVPVKIFSHDGGVFSARAAGRLLCLFIEV